MFKHLKFSVFTLASSIILLSCQTKKSDSAATPDSVAEKTATTPNDNLKKAPSFEVTTITGEKISLKQSLEEKKPTVVYFTASWCPMCAQNWPGISATYPEFKDKINFVAISIDPTDTKEVMTKLAEEKGFEFPVAAGNPQVMLDFGVESQATTIGIDTDGAIVFQKNKTVLSADEYRGLFEQLLN